MWPNERVEMEGKYSRWENGRMGAIVARSATVAVRQTTTTNTDGSVSPVEDAMRHAIQWAANHDCK